MSLDKTLLRLRKETNLTQEDVAEVLEVTRQTVSNWENGNAIPSITKAKELATLYNISLNQLVDMDDTDASTTFPPLLKGWEGRVCSLTLQEPDSDGVVINCTIIEVDLPWLTLEVHKRKENISKIIHVDSVASFRRLAS